MGEAQKYIVINVSLSLLKVCVANPTLQIMLETGIISHVTRSYVPMEYLYPAPETAPLPQRFTTMHIFGALGVLALGLTIAGIAFTLELANNKY